MVKNVILHIEDDAGLATAVAYGLKDAGYKVVQAHSAEDGLRKVRTIRPNLIILDLSMPGLSGSTVINQLTMPDGSTTVPILVFTGFAGRLSDDIRSRVDGFLLKPVSIKALVAEIERIMAADEAKTDDD